MLWILGTIFGASVVGLAWMAADWRSVERTHREYVREWQRANNGWAIIRTRHRRADKHKAPAPLPLDIAGAQMRECGACRMMRKGGRWQ